MAIYNPLDTGTVSLSDMLGNGKTYIVPPYQRDYSWDRDHWEDLWNDIENISDKGHVHYMGTIVLQRTKESGKIFRVIDGQQRLATLTVIVLAIIDMLNTLIEAGIEKQENQERVNLLKKKYIGDKDPASLTYSSKLQLNENNNSFFQSNLLVFRPPRNTNTLQDSDKKIWEAYKYFSNQVRVRFEGENRGKVVTNFLDKLIAEKLMFIQIRVEDELSAYTVFETLNSRGVGLTVTDLLKNYLFSVSSAVDLPHVKDKWKKTVDFIGLDNFPVFLRHFWISKYTLIRQDYLFRAVKEVISDSPSVISLLDELEENAQLYVALSNYADSFWGGHRGIKKRVKELALFKEEQAYPILIAAYNHFSLEEFARVLKLVSIITFRYSIIGNLYSKQKEVVYHKAARLIASGRATLSRELLDTLQVLYPSDIDFKNNFASKSINTKRGKKLVRYILFSLENYISENDYDFEESPATIEHILPEKGNDNYLSDFPPSIHESLVYRLGNYTLLEDNKNRECQVLAFVEKKNIYASSQYKLTHNIDSNSWTPNTIERRQDRLASYAATIWRISQYDHL